MLVFVHLGRRAGSITDNFFYSVLVIQIRKKVLGAMVFFKAIKRTGTHQRFKTPFIYRAAVDTFCKIKNAFEWTGCVTFFKYRSSRCFSYTFNSRHTETYFSLFVNG